MIWFTTGVFVFGIYYSIESKYEHIMEYIVESVYLVLILKQLKERGQFPETEKRINYEERRFVRLIMKKQICFAVCWLPMLIFGFLSITGYFKGSNEGTVIDTTNMSIWLHLQIQFSIL